MNIEQLKAWLEQQLVEWSAVELASRDAYRQEGISGTAKAHFKRDANMALGRIQQISRTIYEMEKGEEQ